MPKHAATILRIACKSLLAVDVPCQRVGDDTGYRQDAGPVRPVHDAADCRSERHQRPHRVHILARVGEEHAVPAVEPTAVDEERFAAVVQGCPINPLLVEVQRWGSRSRSSSRSVSASLRFAGSRRSSPSSPGGRSFLRWARSEQGTAGPQRTAVPVSATGESVAV